MKEHEKLEKMLDDCAKSDVNDKTLEHCLLGSIASSLATIADVMAEGRESKNEPCGDS